MYGWYLFVWGYVQIIPEGIKIGFHGMCVSMLKCLSMTHLIFFEGDDNERRFYGMLCLRSAAI